PLNHSLGALGSISGRSRVGRPGASMGVEGAGAGGAPGLRYSGGWVTRACASICWSRRDSCAPREMHWISRYGCSGTRSGDSKMPLTATRVVSFEVGVTWKLKTEVELISGGAA